MVSDTVLEKIKRDIEEHPVILYMKGDPSAPMCGFSSVVVTILTRLNVPFKGVNVLEDAEIREGIKEYTNWPTIPQLYIKGEFVGGCDIVREMYESGELQTYLKEKNLF